MSEVEEIYVPDGWAKSPLRAISEKLVDGSHNPPKKQDSGLPMLSARNIENGLLNWDANYRFISEEGFELENRRTGIEVNDVLLTIVGTIGRACIVPKNSPKFTLQRSVAVIKPIEIDSKYICYQLQSTRVQRYLTKNAKGTAQQGIYLKALGQLDILVAPPEQQKRIVAKIEELFSHIDAGIEALKKVKQLLKQYRQSVLKAAVTGELTKEWREANKVSQESWVGSTIGEIAKVQTGKTPKRSNEEFWKNGTIPWLTSSATNEVFTHYADQFVTQAAIDDGLKLFEPGTLLLAMYGEGKTRGQVTEITFQATCNQACAAIIVDENKASRAYVRLRLYENYEQIRKAASGGNQPNLNLSKVREISLPLPLLSEQAEIVSEVERKFETIKRLENELETLWIKVEKNKQSILATAFNGVLTC